MAARNPIARTWSYLLCTPRAASAVEQHHARLLAVIVIAIAAIDAFAGIGTRFTEHPATSATLLCAAVLDLVAFVLNRRGARSAALFLVVGSHLVVPPVLTLGSPVSEVGILTLGVWSMPAVLIASAFLPSRAILGVGVAATALFAATQGAHGGFAHPAVLESLTFLATVATLPAVVARHRDTLDAIHQRELQRQNDELQRLRDSLEERVVERTNALLRAEKMATIGRFTAGIAHELSSPLAAVLGSVEELKLLVGEYGQSIGDPAVEAADHRAIQREMSEALDDASRAAERSLVYVRSIKAQTRVSMNGKHEEFEAGALVRDCVQLLAHAVKEANCTIVVRAEEPISVVSLPGRLGQAVTNLLQNAIDATGERGGGTITVDVARGDGATFLVRVQDHGGGIADDVLPRIFEPLFTTKPYGRGTGLGLAIVKEVVEGDLGGRIRVHTTVGQGTAFVIELPEGRKDEDRAA